MKILVTGGAGFIGSHIVDQILAGGHQAVVVDDMSSGDKSNLPADGSVKLHEVDVRDRDAVMAVFAAENPDRICHQAAQLSVSKSVQDPELDASINVMGLINVLDASVKNGVERFVFASSGGVLYGDVDTPAPEETPANPISPYGITKWVGERYMKFYAAEHGLKGVALRYSNVFGPRQNPHGEAGVVAIFNKLMLAGNTARVNGDGKYIRDYVYCEDVARANYTALTADIPGDFTAFNIGTGVGTDVNELVAHVRKLTQDVLQEAGSDIVVPEPEHGPERAGDLRSNLVDAAKAKREIGWEPKINVEQGLANTATWFAQRAGIKK